MPRTSDARHRALETAERLFRSKGYAATGLAEILAESGAPKGSFYFHFPNGKAQLALEVMANYGARVRRDLAGLAARFEGDPPGFVDALVRAIGAEMAASDWRLGCAAHNLASEIAHSDPVLAAAVKAVFDDWLEVLAAALGGATAEVARARSLRLLAALEGARILAKLSRSTEPLRAVAEGWGSVERS